jgi:phospholipid/cholesterol/gamma-HCH transport system permease protein
MMLLLWEIVRKSFIHPTEYLNEITEQMFALLRLCTIPIIVSTVAFGFSTPGIQAGGFFRLVGVPERLGAFFIMASTREFAPWINAMVIAGVIGTALTADLGSRRVREEFDAMEVLGVDPVREIIIPRVIAVTVMTGLMDIVALAFGVCGGWLASQEMGSTTAAFAASFWANTTTPDLWGSVVKTTVFGLIIAVVCSYKGYRAEGGAIGVGKAVNQAVVVSFALIFVVNFLFVSLLLGLNPEIQVYR